MVKLGNFSSVFEIAFAINALLYIFEVAPFTESRIEKKLKTFDKLKKEKIEKTKGFEAPPVCLVLSLTYPEAKGYLAYVSIFMSLLSLGLLVLSGFRPETEFPSLIMSIIIILIILTVPIAAYLLHRFCSTIILSGINLLKESITQTKDN